MRGERRGEEVNPPQNQNFTRNVIIAIICFVVFSLLLIISTALKIRLNDRLWHTSLPPLTTRHWVTRVTRTGIQAPVPLPPGPVEYCWPIWVAISRVRLWTRFWNKKPTAARIVVTRACLRDGIRLVTVYRRPLQNVHVEKRDEKFNDGPIGVCTLRVYDDVHTDHALFPQESRETLNPKYKQRCFL